MLAVEMSIDRLRMNAHVIVTNMLSTSMVREATAYRFQYNVGETTVKRASGQDFIMMAVQFEC